MFGPVYFKDGTFFANDYIRIVHGKRGKYMELLKDQIKIKLKPKYNCELPNNIIGNEPFYYYWLEPENRTEKIYWQARLVNYADYKIGLYYISPNLVHYNINNNILLF